MKIEKTEDVVSGDSIVMCVYGDAKTGKTSFAASTSKFGKTLVFDFERGTKYLGERGFNCDVIHMQDWFTVADSKSMKALIKDYDYIVVDPVGEAMDMLIDGDQITGSKFRQKDGSLTMPGWAETKNKMRNFIKFLRSSGKTIIFVFHDDKIVEEEETHHSIQIATKIKGVIPGMVDIISYLAVIKRDGETKRILYTPASGSNYDSGDRTGRVPETIELSEFGGWGDFVDALDPLKALKEETVIMKDDKKGQKIVTNEAEESLIQSEEELDVALNQVKE